MFPINISQRMTAFISEKDEFMEIRTNQVNVHSDPFSDPLMYGCLQQRKFFIRGKNLKHFISFLQFYNDELKGQYKDFPKRCYIFPIGEISLAVHIQKADRHPYYQVKVAYDYPCIKHGLNCVGDCEVTFYKFEWEIFLCNLMATKQRCPELFQYQYSLYTAEILQTHQENGNDTQTFRPLLDDMQTIIKENNREECQQTQDDCQNTIAENIDVKENAIENVDYEKQPKSVDEDSVAVYVEGRKANAKQDQRKLEGKSNVELNVFDAAFAAANAALALTKSGDEQANEEVQSEKMSR